MFDLLHAIENTFSKLEAEVKNIKFLNYDLDIVNNFTDALVLYNSNEKSYYWLELYKVNSINDLQDIKYELFYLYNIQTNTFELYKKDIIANIQLIDENSLSELINSENNKLYLLSKDFYRGLLNCKNININQLCLLNIDNLDINMIQLLPQKIYLPYIIDYSNALENIYEFTNLIIEFTIAKQYDYLLEKICNIIYYEIGSVINKLSVLYHNNNYDFIHIEDINQILIGKYVKNINEYIITLQNIYIPIYLPIITKYIKYKLYIKLLNNI